MSDTQSFVQPINKANKHTANKQRNTCKTIVSDRIKLATGVGTNFEIQLRGKGEKRRVKFNQSQSVSIARENQHNMRQPEQDNLRRRDEVELHLSSRAGQRQQPKQTAIDIPPQQAVDQQSPQTVVDNQPEQIVDNSEPQQYL